jgi:putative transposase
MKKRYTEAQIAFALRQATSGTPVAEIVQEMRVSDQTFCRWKKQYADMGVSEIHRMKELEEENRRLKRLGNSDRTTHAVFSMRDRCRNVNCFSRRRSPSHMPALATHIVRTTLLQSCPLFLGLMNNT